MIRRLIFTVVALSLTANSVDAGIIKILRSTRAGAIANANGDDDLNAFYLNEGFTSSLFTGAVTDVALANVDLFVAMLPDDAFTASEITVMDGFLASGGNILFMGDQVGFAAAENGSINAALSALGSGMALGSSSLDPGFNNTTAGQVASHPLTAGVDVINYGNVNSISGISPSNELFLAKNLSTPWAGVESIGAGTIVLLADTNILSNIENRASNDNHIFFRNVATAASVPEPSSLLTLAFLSGTITVWTRRKRVSK